MNWPKKDIPRCPPMYEFCQNLGFYVTHLYRGSPGSCGDWYEKLKPKLKMFGFGLDHRGLPPGPAGQNVCSQAANKPKLGVEPIFTRGALNAFSCQPLAPHANGRHLCISVLRWLHLSHPSNLGWTLLSGCWPPWDVALGCGPWHSSCHQRTFFVKHPLLASGVGYPSHTSNWPWVLVVPNF